MVTREDLVNSPSYWLTKIQIEVFNLLNTYMEENNLTQKQVAAKLNVSPSYVSQILNGNFNFTISKLIELAVLVGKVPVIQFKSTDEMLKLDESTPGKFLDSSKSKASSSSELKSQKVIS